MTAGTEFGLLGPLLVRRGGEVVQVPPGKQRVLLAALLVNANRLVPVDELAEAMWESGPPASARVTLRNYVKRLRQALADPGGSRISTLPGGYLIRVGVGELDVSRFEAHLGAARTAARGSSWDTAATEARAALSLWRGEPLADVDSELLASREVSRLAELRLQALEARVDADLHLGRQAEVITDLRQLVSIHPLRERLHAQLMLALYRDGRQAEALAAYRHVRRVLVEALGVEPGAGLQGLHQRILTADPALDVPVSAPPAAGNAAPSVPRELPAGVRHFAGRAGELEMLTRLLYESDEKVPCMVISAIGGTAGVGKTALALHWAHRAAGRFPDGQLYVNLRGYDPGQPMSATDALTGFLRALGVPGQNIPAGQDERAARYRSLLAGRRMLVILDNASEAEQVRPLLPGSPACAVVVTSRDALVGLVARDGATRLDLDLLPEEDAVGLLRALIGTRVNAEPEAAKALAGQCCRLPLALRVAAELAASRPAVALADLAGELADQQKRLDLLEAGGDSRSAMRAVFSWSCRYLDAGSARQFRLLGLHPGPDFGPYAAAALTGTTVEQACQMLDVLARAHLIQPVPPGRYGMHDLLRAYARELAAAQDADEERRTALAGLFDHYLHAAAAAMDAMFPAEEHQRPRPLAPTQPVPPLPTPAAARDWLEAERACLAAVTVQATADGWPGHAIALASILYRYAESGGHSPDTRALYTSALRAARQTGNLAAQADTLKNLGLVDTWQNHYRQAVGELGSALDLYRKIGDRLGEARTLNSLGIGHFRLGRLQQAGFHHQQAVALFRELGERLGEAAALTNLGIAELRQGLYDRAAGHHLECVAIFREFGNRRGEAYALQNLGHVLQGQARYQQAAGFHRQALALFREIGDRSTEAASLNSLGEALSGAGLHGPARAQHDDALAVACQIGDRYEQARAHNGIASSHHAVGDPGQARHHWQQALNLYAELGAPEADHVRAQLSTAHDDGHSES